MAIDVVFASGPTYNNGSNDFLIPFTYKSGVLSLPTAGPFDSGSPDHVLGNAGASIRILGGTFNVTSLGTNLRNFIVSKKWDNYTITGTATSIQLKSAPTLTKVQQLSSKFLAPTWDQKAYNVSPNSWDSANFIGPASVYLFTKPLVVEVIATDVPDGGTYTGPICITFQTSWDH